MRHQTILAYKRHFFRINIQFSRINRMSPVYSIFGLRKFVIFTIFPVVTCSNLNVWFWITSYFNVPHFIVRVIFIFFRELIELNVSTKTGAQTFFNAWYNLITLQIIKRWMCIVFGFFFIYYVSSLYLLSSLYKNKNYSFSKIIFKYAP